MKLESSTQPSYRVVVFGIQPGRSRAEFVATSASTWKVGASYVNQVFSKSGLTVKSTGQITICAVRTIRLRWGYAMARTRAGFLSMGIAPSKRLQAKNPMERSWIRCRKSIVASNCDGSPAPVALLELISVGSASCLYNRKPATVIPAADPAIGRQA